MEQEIFQIRWPDADTESSDLVKREATIGMIIPRRDVGTTAASRKVPQQKLRTFSRDDDLEGAIIEHVESHATEALVHSKDGHMAFLPVRS